MEEDETTATVSCWECSKEFSDSFSLKEHTRKIHRDTAYRCEYCNYTAKFKPLLVRHIKRHNSVSLSREKHFKCPLCNRFESVDRSVMINHYIKMHDVSIHTSIYKFGDIGGFNDWKNGIEKQGACRFTVSSGARKSKKKRIKQFRCFRDGFYKPKGKGERHLKIKGSNKIGALCPACITISEDVDTGAVQANYQPTHVGHTTELSRLALRASEKAEIAQKLAANVPFDAILDGIRGSLSNSQVDRIHLITRKDLWNIHNTYNANGGGVNYSSDRSSKSDSLIKNIQHQLTPDSVSDNSLEILCACEEVCTTPSSVIVEDLSEQKHSLCHFRQKKEIILQKFNDILNEATCDSDLDIINDVLISLSRRVKPTFLYSDVE